MISYLKEVNFTILRAYPSFLSLSATTTVVSLAKKEVEYGKKDCSI